MPLNYDIKPASLGSSFKAGQKQYHDIQAAREYTAQSPVRKRLAELGVQREEQAVKAGDLDLQNEQTRRYLNDAYRISSIEDPNLRIAEATKLAESYFATPDPMDDEAGNNILQSIQNGTFEQLLDASVKAGVAGGVLQAPKQPSGAVKSWTNPDIAINEDTGKPEYFITNQVTGETQWLGKGPEAKPDEIQLERDKVLARGEAELEMAQRAATVPGTPEYDRLQKASEAEKKANMATADLRYQMVRNKGEAVSLLRDISAGSTGFDGFIKGLIPGSKAFTDQARIRELENHIALGALQELKEKSPTGATGFGQMSEKELKLLTEAIASLDSKMSDEQFKKQLEKVIGHYERSVSMLDFEHMNPPRLKKGVKYTDEDKAVVARDFAQMAIDAGISTDDAVQMLRQEGFNPEDLVKILKKGVPSG